jgi:hypothetical protein
VPKAEEKEIYRLWWEYLKRSECYKSHLEEMEWNFSYVDALSAGLDEPLNFTALFFGDIWNQSFEQWWKREMNKVATRAKPDPAVRHPHIEDALPDVLMGISFAYYRFMERNYIQAPNEDQLKNGFLNHMRSLSRHGKVTLIVDIHAPMEELVKEFRGYISQKRKDHKAREYAMKIKGIKGKPTKDKLRDELQRYLDVYDLTNEGLSIEQIIEKIGTPAQRESVKKKRQSAKERETSDKSKDHGYDSETVERMYRRDLEKAKRIIDNVGRGFFPGDYD